MAYSELLNTLEVRRAGLRDIEVLVGFRLALLKELGRTLPPLRVAENMSRSWMLSRLSQNVFLAWMAVERSMPVGCGGLTLIDRCPFYAGIESGTEGYVLNMYTVDSHRGRGVARLILDQIIAYARTQGLQRLTLHPSPGLAAFYQRAGFHPVFGEMEAWLR